MNWVRPYAFFKEFIPLLFSAVLLKQISQRPQPNLIPVCLISQKTAGYTTELIHWRPLAAQIKFKSLMLSYSVTSGSTASYLNLIILPCAPSRPLNSPREQLLPAHKAGSEQAVLVQGITTSSPLLSGRRHPSLYLKNSYEDSYLQIPPCFNISAGF